MVADISFFAAFFAGLISFVSPCVLPLVPPYLCFLAGTTLDQLTKEEGVDRAVRRRAVLAALAFVLGFSTVFILLGATASVLGQVLRQYMSWLEIIAGVLIIVMGLHFLGVFRIGLLFKEARIQTSGRPVGLAGAYGMGLAFGFGWTPCIGPILAAILAVAASRETVNEGIVLLMIYSAGLGVPFLLAALGMGSFIKVMKRFRGQFHNVERAMGGLLVVTGVLFLTGMMSSMAFWLLETFPVLATVG
ncbi:MAG: cytochrome c biogenesis protein CcdA [Pseudomonadota bacterium]